MPEPAGAMPEPPAEPPGPAPRPPRPPRPPLPPKPAAPRPPPGAPANGFHSGCAAITFAASGSWERRAFMALFTVAKSAAGSGGGPPKPPPKPPEPKPPAAPPARPPRRPEPPALPAPGPGVMVAVGAGGGGGGGGGASWASTTGMATSALAAKREAINLDLFMELLRQGEDKAVTPRQSRQVANI